MLVQTEQEKILQLASQGLTDYMIAAKLSIEAPMVTLVRLNAFWKIKQVRLIQLF
jgi:DNA-binding NarL/FixJ family response regulator